MEPYFYSYMNKLQQNIYHKMKAGLTALEPSFMVPRPEDRAGEGRELSDIFCKLRLDCPEIFYAAGFRFRFYPDSDHAEMIPEYLFDKGKIKEHKKAMEARVDKLARGAQNMTEWEKEVYIHDFVCRNVCYDKLKKPYSHEIIGPLGHGVGVCEGIAKTVKILCDALGIWCVIAISDANPEKGVKYRHAWNIVKIGGQYYHLDATYDNTLGRAIAAQDAAIRYDYFNLEDKQIFRDHEPLLYKAPVCPDGQHFYYKEKKRSFTKMEEVASRAEQAAKKNIPLVFHWRGSSLNHEIAAELLQTIGHAALKKARYARVGVNWQQAVFHVTFEDQDCEQKLVTEIADEENMAAGYEAVHTSM